MEENPFHYGELVKTLEPVMGLVDAGEIGMIKDVGVAFFYLVEFGHEDTGKLVAVRLHISKLARV
jgi:hypothetical protein